MHKRRQSVLGGLGLAAAAGLLWTTSVGATSGGHRGDLPIFGPGDSYHPVIERADFSPNITNRWFPLKPGTTLVYEGTKDGLPARNVFHVTSRTKVIDGVLCRVVFDQLFLDGKLAERTYDYYSQDDDGNVWYFGEDTVSLDDQGHLTDTSGSFRAGVNGAQPGVFMEAHPELGRWFRQEWAKGEAEDAFRVVDRSTTVKVPFGTFRHALRTEEQTALEPDVLDNKYWVRGIGQVEEVSVKGPLEKLLLVSVSIP